MRLYSLLTIIEAVLILDSSEWLALNTEACWARPAHIPGDPFPGSPYWEFLLAMPLALTLLTNVAGWYLLRYDDWQALRVRNKAGRALLLWLLNACAARCYYQTLLSGCFLDPSAKVAVCLVEGLVAAVVCVLMAGLASGAPSPRVPASLLWLWDGDGTHGEPLATTACHRSGNDCASKAEGGRNGENH